MRKTVLAIGTLSLTFAGSLAWAHAPHRPWLMIGGYPEQRITRVAGKPKHREAVSRNEKVLYRPSGNSDVRGSQIAKQALRYKGSRYQFGGATKKGMDCSGLVSRVYADLKMKKIPRASTALYQSGKPVRLAELRPGDLVFFKNTYKRGISHVGVYAGHNKFVHAANHRRGVTITAMSDPYYQLHYAGARRLY
jgi:cell wall-associated NlpC family hydrolase